MIILRRYKICYTANTFFRFPRIYGIALKRTFCVEFVHGEEDLSIKLASICIRMYHKQRSNLFLLFNPSSCYRISISCICFCLQNRTLNFTKLIFNIFIIQQNDAQMKQKHILVIRQSIMLLTALCEKFIAKNSIS